MTDSIGPVTEAEAQAIAAQLSELSARAAEHGQRLFHFVLSTASESLNDNLEMVLEIEAGDDAS
jgi:hypothetical protein